MKTGFPSKILNKQNLWEKKGSCEPSDAGKNSLRVCRHEVQDPETISHMTRWRETSDSLGCKFTTAFPPAKHVTTYFFSSGINKGADFYKTEHQHKRSIRFQPRIFILGLRVVESE